MTKADAVIIAAIEGGVPSLVKARALVESVFSTTSATLTKLPCS
jgi:hypothetical protein